MGHTGCVQSLSSRSDDRPLEDETTWEGRGYNDVTPFIAVRTRLERRRGDVSSERSAIRADLIGAPEDRARPRPSRAPEARSRTSFATWRCSSGPEARRRRSASCSDATDDDEEDVRTHGWAILDDLVLLEPLVRAVARGDDSLDRVAPAA